MSTHVIFLGWIRASDVLRENLITWSGLTSKMR